MKIFITGVTGFVGGSLANRFLQEGHEVSGIGRKESLPQHVDKRCRYLTHDITKPLREISADIVIHAAAQVDDAANYPDHYANNVTGTINVINACKKVSQFILISTSSVYAFSHEKAYAEEEAGIEFEQLSHYGKTKFLAEQELLKATDIPSKIILRPRAVYGPGDTVLLPRLLALVKNKRMILPAHITQQISLTHIHNLTDAVALSFRLAGKDNCIYNITDDAVYSLKTAIPALVRAVYDEPFKIYTMPTTLWNLILRVNSVFHFIPQLTKFGSNQLTKTALLNISNAKESLGYSPKYSFYESLIEIGCWYKRTL